jgi:hypothetical protein
MCIDICGNGSVITRWSGGTCGGRFGFLCRFAEDFIVSLAFEMHLQRHRQTWRSAKPNDSTSEDVHDQHHPVAAQEYRFNAEQIDTPDAVPRVSDQGEPGRSIGTRLRSKVYGKHATHDIFVDFDAKGGSCRLNLKKRNFGEFPCSFP